jgi:hypothetical protein
MTTRSAINDLQRRRSYGDLCDYWTGNTLRAATRDEDRASFGDSDNGRGVIAVEGKACYVTHPGLVLRDPVPSRIP